MSAQNIIFYLDKLILFNLPKKQQRFNELLKELGRSFTDHQENSLLEKYCEINQPKAKECYRNSLLLALVCDNIDYVEGYLYSSSLGLPIEHAWNVDSKNESQIIDTTAHRMNFKKNTDEYFGVVIPKEILQNYMETDQRLSALQYYLFNKDTDGL